MKPSEWAAQAKASPEAAQAAIISREVVQEPALQDGTLRDVVMSTASVDRARDVIHQEGWDLAHFSANPVLLWCHDYSMPPVGQVVGATVDGGRLIGRQIIFARDVSAFAKVVGDMYTHERRFLRGFSIGMLPQEWTYDEERGGLDFLKQQLLELSCCPVPMNADCLSGAKSAGLEVGAFLPFAAKRLDGATDAPPWLSDREAGIIYRTLAPPMVQVPAAVPSATVAAPTTQPKGSGTRKAIEALTRTLEERLGSMDSRLSALEKAPPVPAPQPTPAPKRAAITPEQARGLAKTLLAEALGPITGRTTPR